MIARRSSWVADRTEGPTFALVRALETIMLPARDQARAQDAPARPEGGGAHRPRRKDDVAELHPLLSVRDGPRPGLLGHRCRRQPLPRLHSGIAVVTTGHSHPKVVA